MKKIARSKSESLPRVKLYLDGLERIVDILQKVSSEIRITTEEFKLENIGQLVDLKVDYLTQLKIESWNPYLSLELAPFQIWLYISDDEPTLRGAYEMIKAVLLQSKPIFPRWLYTPYVPAIFIGAFTILLLRLLPLGDVLGGALAALGLLGAVLWSVYGYVYATTKHSVIIPRYRVDAPSFLTRNSDRIIIAILSAVATAGAAFVVTRLFGG